MNRPTYCFDYTKIGNFLKNSFNHISMILSLDISTSVIGYTMLENNAKFIDIGYLDLKKFEDLYEKLDYFKDFLLIKKQQYNIEKVFIEEPLMAFGKGLSMASTLSKLQRFNGFVSSCIYCNIGIKSILINASHARKLVGIKLIRGQNTKDIVLDFVQKLNVIPENKWEKKKTGKPRETNYDMSDSFVIGLCGIKECGI